MFLSIAKGIWLGTVGIVFLAIGLICFGPLLTETFRWRMRRKLKSEYVFGYQKAQKRRFVDWLVKSALDATGI